ncbi:hypothetical protein KQI76_01650 [Amphibacillus sp. MSJ-3]|uniref:hypothetical protein n=1 Tax=Amphibacillus sp. MSJ-3 TaxID=2841505 RepID=UPI001C0F2089|nr:hypothetical protein [Amphibacillus sp. MSJ-3]MBU5593856.1 hypothetical protein [Amphibacillus sp. MSJ-3]
MRKFLIAFGVLLLSITMLAACNDKDENTNDSEQPEEQVDENSDENNENDDLATDDQTEDAADLDVEDQVDLSIGDTGHFYTDIGSYDMTVTTAELKGYELEGIESQLDDWILLDVTIKNTSDTTLNVEDIMGTMEVTDNLEGSGSIGAVGAFDSVEDFQGEIGPGEEQSGQFITEVFEADQYYFRKISGNVAGGSSNQVIWTIKAEDLK